MIQFAWRSFCFLPLVLTALSAARAESAVFNVRDRGATGDGKTLDTVAINRAIDACSAAGEGQVLFPPGKYLTGTIQLKSHVTISLDAGATIIGTTDLDQYRGYTPPGDTPLADRLRWHRALIVGDGVKDVSIVGRGAIDGNKVPDPRGEERMRGPHAVLFGNSKHITIRDVSIRDAANYAVMLELTSDVEIRGVTIAGGWDGVHFRGWKDRPCRDIRIMDCDFYTGDDCIAGWYWQDTLIDRCVINSSCNGIRLIGPANKLIIHDCLFFGPGKYEHLTSRDKHRTNMLAGLCLQPGAWGSTEGSVDDVHISDIVMHDVASPLHLSAAKGNRIGRVTVDRLTATGAYRAAASIESWGDDAVQRVSLHDVSMRFVAGSREAQATETANKPGVDVRPLPAWGLYARHVDWLELDNVCLGVEGDDRRPAVMADGVRSLDFGRLQLPSQSKLPLLFREVKEVHTPTVAKKAAAPKCVGLKLENGSDSIVASLEAMEAGLAQVEIKIDGNTHSQWVWIPLGRSELQFAKLGGSLGVGKHQIQCGDVSLDVDRVRRGQ
jgi:Pectate lyase superfamily protein